MRLDNQQASQNVEDRRGMGGGGMGRGLAGGGIGMVILVLAAMFFGIDPSVIMQTAQQIPLPQQEQVEGPRGTSAADDEMKQFVAKVLGSTESTWGGIFQTSGRQYPPPTLVLFSGVVQSACGHAQAATGPFYCGADQKLYIDLSFYQELRERFKSPGDFAQAYVIAHEVGHHIQNLMGTMQKVQSLQQRVGEREANALSVRLELQADCYAGIWAGQANRERRILEQGDVEEGLNAATQIGDDRMMMRSKGYVVPEAFTHGSGAQRVRWFRTGLEAQSLSACDTFKQGAV